MSDDHESKEVMNELIKSIQVVSAFDARQARTQYIQKVVKLKAESISKMILEHAQESFCEVTISLASLPCGVQKWIHKIFTKSGYRVFYEDRDGTPSDTDEDSEIMVISWEEAVDIDPDAAVDAEEEIEVEVAP
jgi:DNA-directed RNA polymerase subunit F